MIRQKADSFGVLRMAATAPATGCARSPPPALSRPQTVLFLQQSHDRLLVLQNEIQALLILLDVHLVGQDRFLVARDRILVRKDGRLVVENKLLVGQNIRLRHSVGTPGWILAVGFR